MQKCPSLQRTSGRRRVEPRRLTPQEQLFAACMRGDRRAAEQALERGADLSAPLMEVPLKSRRGAGGTQYRPNLLLHAVVAAGDVPLTDLLLSRGADPRRTDHAGHTALHVLAGAARLETAAVGKLARLLVAAGTPLELTDGAGRSACHLAAGAGHTAALAALAQLGADCGRADSSDDTPLHAAVRSGSALTTLLALRLYPAALSHTNSAGQTPLAAASGADTARPLLAAGAEVDADTLLALVRRAPDAVPAALDSLVTTNDEPLDSSILQVRVSFEALCGGGNGGSSGGGSGEGGGSAGDGESRLLSAIVSSRQHDLLKHDTLEPFLHAKWRRVRWLYYANLALCALLTLLVSGYCWARLERPGGAAQTALAAAVVPLAGAMAVREAFQLANDPRAYVRSCENWLEVVLLLLISVLMLGPSGIPVTSVGGGGGVANSVFWNPARNGTVPVTGTSTAARHHWLEHTVAWTLPVAWLELTLMLARFPNFGVYIHMFVSAAQRLMLLVFLLTPLVCGFALGFHVLLGAPSSPSGQWTPLTSDDWRPFGTLPVSHLTTCMMMVGEYNYDDVFLGSGFGGSAGPLLALFIALMSIMSVNLLIGLTVADTRSVFRAAKLISLHHTAVQVLQVDNVLRSTLLRALLPDRLLRRQLLRADVLPLLRAGGGGGQSGGGGVSPAVFLPNRPCHRRTIYRRSGDAEDGALVPSGLQTRGWMQRGLLTLLRRRQQQQADQQRQRQQERLLDALLTELSRPSAVTEVELTVLSRAARPEYGPHTTATSPQPPGDDQSSPVRSPDNKNGQELPTQTGNIEVDQKPKPPTSHGAESKRSPSTTEYTETDHRSSTPDSRLHSSDTDSSEDSSTESHPSDPPRARKTGAHISAPPGRAERRQQRKREEAEARRRAAAVLSQQLDAVLAAVGGLSRRLATVQRRLAAGERLTSDEPSGRYSYG